MRVLVTGSDGFIGSHLVEELVRRGYDVRAFVMYNSFNSWGWLDHLPKNILTGRLHDLTEVRKVRVFRCFVITHSSLNEYHKILRAHNPASAYTSDAIVIY